MARGQAGARWVLSPGLEGAPVLDRLCSHFVLTLTLRQAGRFNLRRDCNSLLALTGRHLVWPPAVLARVRSYLGLQVQGKSDFDASRTCAGMPSSAGASTPTVRSRSAASQGSETLARC